MIKALAWKEYREQRGVWLVMAAFTGLVLVVFTPWVVPDRLPPWERRALFLAAGAILAWAYGVVCGGMLLAGEREGGTLAFLEGLPARRQQLWAAKCLTGTALVLGFAALAVVLTAVQFGLEVWWQPAVLVLGGLSGLGWGLAFSARGNGVLAVIGRAVGAQLAAGLVLMGLLMLIDVVAGGNLTRSPGMLETFVGVGTAVLAAMAYVRSRAVYCIPEGLPAVAGPGRWARLRSGLPARRFVGVLAFTALTAGAAMAFLGGRFWPPVTLLVGVACGVAALTPRPLARSASEGATLTRSASEETRGPWALRAASHALLALVATVLVATPGLLMLKTGEVLRPTDDRLGLAELFGEHLLVVLPPPVIFLSVWVIYGFAFGLLWSALVRSPRVAAALAILTALPGLAVWLPSMLGGGLHLWQTAGIPVLALVASGWIYGMAGRPVLWRVFTPLAVCGLLAVLATAGALWYRVAEVPLRPDVVHLDLLLRGLSDPDKDEAGQLTREALSNLGPRFNRGFSELARKPLFPMEKDPNPSLAFSIQVSVVLERGWPPGPEPELGAWLDGVFQEPWADLLARAADLPGGVVADPRQSTVNDQLLRSMIGTQGAGVLLAAHGLCQQARGDASVFVSDLKTALALSRNLRRHGGHFATVIANRIEHNLLQALDRWMERLDGQPNLLRQVLILLQRHQAERLDDPDDEMRCEFLIACNSLAHPEDWLENVTRRRPPQQGEETGAGLVSLAWRMPWERVRLLRLLQHAVGRDRRQASAADIGEPWLNSQTRFLWEDVRVQSETRQRPGALTDLRAGELKVALRLYQAEKGKLPVSLAQLVPTYLTAVPTDPFDPDAKPFRYRVSRGEGIEDMDQLTGKEITRKVAGSQAVLWSVSWDGVDGGGHRQQQGDSVPGDLIFLVPLPPGK
jgi:hypothetical protein